MVPVVAGVVPTGISGARGGGSIGAGGAREGAATTTGSKGSAGKWRAPDAGVEPCGGGVPWEWEDV